MKPLIGLLLLLTTFSINAQTVVSPHAPDIAIYEMENQLILTIRNDTSSNNYLESYKAIDSSLLVVFPNLVNLTYKFQGYQIFQVVSPTVGLEDLQDPTKARVVGQCDIIDDVRNIININYDSSLSLSSPVLMVEGFNQGIQHSFLLTRDAFTPTEEALVNFKEYYFLAVAYAYLELPYTPQFYPSGIHQQYLCSSTAVNGPIRISTGVPHKRQVENNGTEILSAYGDGPEITQYDGVGNGGRILELTEESLQTIINDGVDLTPTYTGKNGPINIKIVNPANVKWGRYLCRLHSYVPSSRNGVDSASWTIYRYDYLGGNLLDSVHSDYRISQKNEQLIEAWGISVEITQSLYFLPKNFQNTSANRSTKVLSSSLKYANDTDHWLDFVHDNDIYAPSNWVRSGSFQNVIEWEDLYTHCYNDDVGVDEIGQFDNLIEGGLAPFRLTGYQCAGMPIAFYNYTSQAITRRRASLSYLPSVDIVFTKDKSKWTRCPVIELGRDDNLSVGHVDAGALRGSLSVDKEGNPDGSGTTGMGWFPGYAIDIESGARLYMAFGENSFSGLDNGNDMIWNPSERLVDGLNNYVLGGMHAIWVMSYMNKSKNNDLLAYDYPAYIPSEAEELATNALYQDFLAIEANNNPTKRNVYSSISWIINPLLKKNESLLSSDLTMKIRINKEYKNFVSTGWNNGEPMYSWDMEELQSTANSDRALAKSLECMNVFPNPLNQQHTKFHDHVKVINLPEICQIDIVDIKGTHIHSYSKHNLSTSYDWDLRNANGVAVSSGLYLIHISVPGIGERTLISSIVR